MSKVRVWYVGLAALALAGCGQTGQAPSASASAAAASLGATPQSSAIAQPIASAIVSQAKLSGQACSLDTIDGSYDARVALDRNKPHAFRGWLANDQGKPAGTFQIVLVGASDFGIEAHTGLARPDVAANLKNPALADAGFNVAASPQSVGAGKYDVRLLMQANEKSSVCDTKKTIVLN